MTSEKTMPKHGTGLHDHIEATVAAISDLHAEHYRKVVAYSVWCR
jgi:hypothetical protein